MAFATTPFTPHLIEWTPDCQTRLIEDLGVDHRCGDIGVTEEFLHRADVIAILQQVGRKGMT